MLSPESSGDIESREDENVAPELAQEGDPLLALGPMRQAQLPEPIGSDSDDDPPFLNLDRNAIRHWRTANLLVDGSIAGLLACVGAALWFLTPTPRLVIGLIWLCFAAWSVWEICWFPTLNYSHWSYRLTPLTFEMRHGFLWRHFVLIPLSRVQHADLHQSPMERHFGLASLELHTAGTRNASHRLPGLAKGTALELRDQIVATAGVGEEG